MSNYILFTPMRNEISTIEITLKCVITQTLKPTLWLIMDDGSNDGSSELVKAYSQTHSFIKLKRIKDRGFDNVGEGVAGLFNFFLYLVKDTPCDYIGKLDGDVNIPSNYFEVLMSIMEKDKLIGISSGHPFTYVKNRKVIERHSDFFPSATARLYRFNYLKDIGSFVNSVGWDTVDILRMLMYGYKTKIFNNLEYHHIRRMGTRNGYINGMIRDGKNAYLTGYTPLFFIFRAIFNMKYKPYIFRTICMLWGYFFCQMKKYPFIVTKDEHAFHIKLQKKRLLFRSIE